jgi:hypothetical protein
MTVPGKLLLADILEAMVREWGGEAVSRALDTVLTEGPRHTNAIREEFGRNKERRTSIRPSAVQMVAKSDQPDIARHELLKMIATKYDDKGFLPRLGDIREFVAMMGGERRSIKDRSEGFRLFLESTKDLPLDQLQQIATNESFSGPSQLGPLSDAIGASGEARRQQRLASQNSPDLSDQSLDSPYADKMNPVKLPQEKE